MLAIFHKLETSKKTRKVRECCPLLRRETDQVRREREGERERELLSSCFVLLMQDRRQVAGAEEASEEEKPDR